MKETHCALQAEPHNSQTTKRTPMKETFRALKTEPHNSQTTKRTPMKETFRALKTEHHNNNPRQQFCATTKLDGNLQPDGTNFGYVVEESHIKLYGSSIAFLIAMIHALSAKKGYCFMHNNTFASRLGVTLKTVECWLKRLQEEGVIYRNTWNTPAGRTRHIVPRSKFLVYWKTFMHRKSVKTEVKKKYLEFIFEGKVPESYSNPEKPKKGMRPPKKKPDKPQYSTKSLPEKGPKKAFPPPSEKGVHATHLERGCLLRKKNKEKNTTTYIHPDPNVVVFSFEDKIQKELQSIRIPQDQIDVAKRYYQLLKSSVDSKNNPMGYIVQGIKQGWVAEVVHNAENNPKGEQADRLTEKQCRESKRFLRQVNEHIDHNALKVSADDYCVMVDIKSENRRDPLGIAEKKTLKKIFGLLAKFDQQKAMQYFYDNLPSTLREFLMPSEKEPATC